MNTDQGRLFHLVMETPLIQPVTGRASRSDFDHTDAGLQVRRSAIDHEIDTDNDAEYYAEAYGVFAYVDGKFYVIIKGFISWKPIGFEEYASLEDLKRVWELD